MPHIPGTSIVSPSTPILGPHTVRGDYSNPFTPGSLEYDGYQKSYNISHAVQTGKNNANAALGAFKDVAKETVDKVKDGDSSGFDPTGMYKLYDPNSASFSSPATPQQLQYIDAPYAEMYGMDASTAYQEALANTAYQRKVKDLKAAGLNPVLGYSGAGAANFYGTPATGVSSSGGVSYGSSGSGKITSGLSDKQKDTLIRNLPKAIGGVVSIIKGPSAGDATSAIGNAIGNIIRYW